LEIVLPSGQRPPQFSLAHIAIAAPLGSSDLGSPVGSGALYHKLIQSNPDFSLQQLLVHCNIKILFNSVAIPIQ
jgi:hypothetical protein